MNEYLFINMNIVPDKNKQSIFIYTILNTNHAIFLYNIIPYKVCNRVNK